MLDVFLLRHGWTQVSAITNLSTILKDHGICAEKVNVNFSKMSERVAKVVSDTCDGINFLMKKNNITVYTGHGIFIDEHTLKIANDKEEIIKGKNIVIATGPGLRVFQVLKLIKKRVITSTEALKMPELPKSIVVIGGGVIGLELGSVFMRLGSKVSVVEIC